MTAHNVGLGAWLACSSLSGALFVWTDNPWFLTGAVVLACCGYGRHAGAAR